MSTDLKHTPGPWIAYNGIDIATDRTPGQRHLIASVKALETNAVANARLIAASPELLGALTDTMEALAMCQPRTDHGARCQSDAMLKARAAIAKATGQ